MAGEKFELLKMSCMFTVHNLEATDRLSIVASSNGGLLLPLIAMSDETKSLANSFIESLDAYGGSNLELEAAMELTYKVLRERSDDERVSSIILVTDGHLQGSVESISSTGRYPTYALGIGDDHDPQALYSFATRGHGTYSFTSHELGSIPDAMALHIGGLTSIVAQDVRISIRSAHPDVRISGITCGAYDCSIDASRSGTITVNDLCGNEEKNLLVYVDVPEEQAAGIFAGTPKTKLLTVASSYRSPVTGARAHSDTVEVAVDRPGRLRGQDHSISVEVASEVTRASVFAGVKEIWRETSERPDLGTNWPAVGEDLAEKLNALRDSISSTEEARAAQDRWDDLGMDLDSMQRDISRVVSRSKDGLGGVGSHVAGSVAYMLSWLSSHQWQRAATPGSTSKSRWFSFRTVRMQNMIDSVSVERAPSAFY